MVLSLRSAATTALGSVLLAVGVGACAPALRAETAVAVQAPDAASVARRYLGVWALSDSANNLFNVRLSADGRAVSTWGAKTMPQVGQLPAGSGVPLRPGELFEQGRWQPWGNGVRIDYADGWSDWLLVGPSGPSQYSWAPGSDRLAPPENFARAVKLSGVEAEVVGVYRLTPTQPNKPPYTASLLSNGQAFNSIDAIPSGSWRVERGNVVIDWLSGWRTVLIGTSGGQRKVEHWAPGVDRQAPPSAVRSGERLN
jgi:hypothetical protein